MPNIKKASTPLSSISDAGLKFRRISSTGSMVFVSSVGSVALFLWCGQPRAAAALRTAAR